MKLIGSGAGDGVQNAAVATSIFRPIVCAENLNLENKELAHIEMPFTIEYFGGWGKAYPEVIEGVFKNQVQRK